jgi:TolB-like protein
MKNEKEQRASSKEQSGNYSNIFSLPLLIALCSLLIFACGGTPQANSPDELDSAIRDASDYLNENIPAGSKIVILNIESNSTALSEYIIDELIANAVNDRLFEVVDRQQLDLIREEQNFQWAGEVDDNLALEVGRFFGAQIIVSGRVSQIADRYRFTVRALEVQTARVVGQNNFNIVAGATISALMRSQATASGSGSRTQTTSESGTAQTAPAQPTTPQATAQTTAPTTQPTAPANGTYPFWPRPKGKRAGMPVDAYIFKIVVDGRYMLIYMSNTERGAIHNNDPIGDWRQGNTFLTNIDRPSQSWQPVSRISNWDNKGQGTVLSFEGVTITRFRLESTIGPVIFEEINLADAEWEL